RLEFYSPPYMNVARPSYTGLPAIINYNATFNLSVTHPANTINVTGMWHRASAIRPSWARALPHLWMKPLSPS
ncbi:hypothetical protein B0H16DRAFT_1313163, partial [Mycena metata]